MTILGGVYFFGALSPGAGIDTDGTRAFLAGGGGSTKSAGGCLSFGGAVTTSSNGVGGWRGGETRPAGGGLGEELMEETELFSKGLRRWESGGVGVLALLVFALGIYAGCAGIDDRLSPRSCAPPGAARP